MIYHLVSRMSLLMLKLSKVAFVLELYEICFHGVIITIRQVNSGSVYPKIHRRKGLLVLSCVSLVCQKVSADFIRKYFVFGLLFWEEFPNV